MPQRFPSPTRRLTTAILANLPLAAALTFAAAPHSVQAKTTASAGAASVPTLYTTVNGAKVAYRRMGPEGGVPLVMLNRFRGTMDEWDPAFIDHVAQRRQVIIFDNIGVARSDGDAPASLTGWAGNAAAFMAALGISEADVLGFSFGGLVAQELALTFPGIVRRLLIVGSGAGYVEGANLQPKALEIATKPVNVDEDFLYLFFKNTPTSQAAGRAHLARLRQRTDAFAKLVSEKAWHAMLAAGSDVGTPAKSLLTRAHRIRHPVLIANGVEDVMIPTVQSFALAQVIPNARLIIYPDSGHAFLFQYPQVFGDEVIRFLDDGAQL